MDPEVAGSIPANGTIGPFRDVRFDECSSHLPSLLNGFKPMGNDLIAISWAMNVQLGSCSLIRHQAALGLPAIDDVAQEFDDYRSSTCFALVTGDDGSRSDQIGMR